MIVRTRSCGDAGRTGHFGDNIRPDRSQAANACFLFCSGQGNLVGWDQRSNAVLSDCIERRFSIESGAVDMPLGVYLIKGDQM